MRVGGRKKLLERPEEPGAALMEEEHQVGQPLGKAHIVGNHDAGESELILGPLDEAAKAAGNDGIDHGGWLVIEHHLRLSRQRAGNGHGAFAAGGEAGRQYVHHVISAHQFDQPPHEHLDLLLGEATALTQRESDVLAHAERIEERAVLENHGHSLANGLHAFFGESCDLLTLDANGARIRLEEAHQHAQRHRFAYAAAAQNAEGLAAIHCEAHVLKNGPAIKGDGHMVEGDDGPGIFSSRC